MSPRYHNFSRKGWSLTIHEVTDLTGEADIVLEGPIGEDGYAGAERMAQIIEEVIKENTWPLVRSSNSET